MGKRAKGRSRQDFFPLNAAEETILEAAAVGGVAVISQTRPEEMSDSNTVRATFLRFLALGGDDEAPVHEQGLQVQGAWITGTLDLSNAEITGALMLLKCRFDQILTLFDAQIRGLFSLKESQVPGLFADRLTCHSGLFLKDGFLTAGEIRLLGATIGGDLTCTGGTFENPSGRAFTADGIKVGGSVFMNDGFNAQGEVRLHSATIGLNLHCSGGKFENPNGRAITADGVKVGGFVVMGNGFMAQGEVRLPSATIGGNWACDGGIFVNPKGRAISADRVKIGASVFMRNGFSAQGEIRLIDAIIGSGVDYSSGTLENPEGRAVFADRMNVGGYIFMQDGFKARGEIRLSGVTIGGNLECDGGIFENQGKVAIRADGMKIGGNVFARHGFSALGEVRLINATIGGDFDCSLGSFYSQNSFAINFQGIHIYGVLLGRSVKISQGAVALASAHVGRLIDDLRSWPENIVLDGFVYGAFSGEASTAAKDRLAWLDKQSLEHSGKAKNPREFRPQPWQQLRKVLRDMGHLEDARQVAIAFENRKRFCGVIGEISEPAPIIRRFLGGKVITFSSPKPVTKWRRLESRTARGFHWLYGAVIGYGYRPARLFWIVVLVWAFSSLLFDIGGHSRVFGPTDPQIFENSAYDPCNPEKNPRANWTRCQAFPRAYPAFYPPLYALDVLLPVGKLGQEDHWAPLAPERALTAKNWLLAWATQFAVWIDMMFGWIAGLLLIATVSGLAKRQDD